LINDLIFIIVQVMCICLEVNAAYVCCVCGRI